MLRAGLALIAVATLAAAGPARAALVAKRVAPAEPGISLLANGALERLTGDGRAFADTHPWQAGYEVDPHHARTGPYSARCASDDAPGQRGLFFTLRLNQQRPLPIRAECWSKAEGVTGRPDAGYSLYLDIIFTDGTPLWGQVHAFATSSHGWERGVVTVVPAKPIAEVRVHGLLRGHRGTAWFDDFALWELRPQGGWSVFDGALVEQADVPLAPGPRVRVDGGGVSLELDAATGRLVRDGRAGGLLVRDAAAGSDFRLPLGTSAPTPGGARFSARDDDLGLDLTADYQARQDHVLIQGTVRDRAGRDRAVTVYLTVPLEARGWWWGRGLRDWPSAAAPDRELIAADGDYQATVEVAGGLGRMARYPFAAVWNASQGWAIAYPLDLPRINRVGYNAAARELYAAVDLGLSAETSRFPGEASFAFLLYRFEPAWGMRAALQRYYEIFPQHFAKRVEREGGWMPFTDIASVEGWRDFGFAFKEGTNNVPFDSAHGIHSFEYVEPVSYWMPMPPQTPRTDEAAWALLARRAAEATGGYAAATPASVIHDQAGEPVMHLLRAPWCDGALFMLNPAPEVPVSADYPVNKAAAMWRVIERALQGRQQPLAHWRPWERPFAVEAAAGPGGEAALRCDNVPGQASGATQTVTLDPPRQEPILARAWSKAEGVTGDPDADYSLYLDLVYADGTSGYGFVAPFPTGSHGWREAQVRIEPPQPVARIYFHLLLRGAHAGRAWFARPQLLVGDSDNLLANPGFAPDDGPAPAVSGAYIDSLEMGAEYLNYRREHWRDLEVPLVFDRAGRCAQALIFGTYEFVAETAQRMRDRGRLMFANGALWRYIQFAPLLDIMGTETNWLRDGQLRPEADEVMLLRRALCHRKPYCLLMNSDYSRFPREYTERYFARCLFYGIFPGFFSHNAADDPYWTRPALYNRDRDLFTRYLPLIQAIAHAGWEPLTHAWSDDARVYVERFGPARAGAPAYLTIMNDADAPRQAAVTADLAALGIPAAAATEMLSGRAIALEQATGRASFAAELAPGEVWLVALGAQDS